MIQHIIEVNGAEFNWGKVMLLKFDKEWSYESRIDPGAPLLPRVGWGNEHIWVLDLQTGEGACFRADPRASIRHDLGQKHKVWVCPICEPFLEWLYRQALSHITKLPAIVNFTAD